MLFSYHLLYFCTALSLIIMLSSHYHHHKSKTFSQLTQCPFTGTLLLFPKSEIVCKGIIYRLLSVFLITAPLVPKQLQTGGEGVGLPTSAPQNLGRFYFHFKFNYNVHAVIHIVLCWDIHYKTTRNPQQMQT